MDIFVDLKGQQLVTSLSGTRLEELRLGENERQWLNVYLCNPPAISGEALVPATLPAGYNAIIVSGRPQADLEEADLLFSTTEFAEQGAGATIHYRGLLDLTTSQVRALLLGAKNAAIFFEVELLSDGGHSRRLTPHQPARIYRDIYRGDESVPTTGNPLYPAAGTVAIKAPVDGNYRINGVQFQLWNSTRGIYQTVSLQGAAGAETLVIHQP